MYLRWLITRLPLVDGAYGISRNTNATCLHQGIKRLEEDGVKLSQEGFTEIDTRGNNLWVRKRN